MLMIELTIGGRHIAVDIERVEAVEDLDGRWPANEGVRLHMYSGRPLHVDGTAKEIMGRMLRAVSYDPQTGIYDASATDVEVGDTIMRDDDNSELAVADIVHETGEDSARTIRFLDSAGKGYVVRHDEVVTLVDR